MQTARRCGSILTKFRLFHDFHKGPPLLPTSNFTKFRPVGAALIRYDGRTDAFNDLRERA